MLSRLRFVFIYCSAQSRHRYSLKAQHGNLSVDFTRIATKWVFKRGIPVYDFERGYYMRTIACLGKYVSLNSTELVNIIKYLDLFYI